MVLVNCSLRECITVLFFKSIKEHKKCLCIENNLIFGI